MNPGKRGTLDRNSGQKGSESRPSPSMHDRSSGKHSPGSSHSPASKCSSIPLLQNEMNRAAAGFLASFTGAPGFTPPVWQDLQYLINPLAPSFMPPIPLGLDMFSSPFLHPMPGSAPGLFPPGLPLLRPPTGSGILHPPYTALFPNVNDIPVHLLSKPDQPGTRPRSAKKTSSLASSSSESDIACRSGASNLPNKHDTKASHSSKQFWHSAAELAKTEPRKPASGSPAVSNSKQDEMVDILSYSDCDHDSPLELTVKKSNKLAVLETEAKRSCPSTEDAVHEDVNSRGSCEILRGLSSEKSQMQPPSDEVADLSLHKSIVESLKTNDQSLKLHTVNSDQFAGDTTRDATWEELREKTSDLQHFRDVSTHETVDLMRTPSFSAADLGSVQTTGLSQAPRQNIALPPRKRLTRNPEELGLGMPCQSTGSDSPSSTSNFRSCWKKFAAKANHNGQPRAFPGGGKPLYDCRTFFQKTAAKDACKSGILIGKTFIAGKGKGYFHRTVSRTSPRFSRNEGGAGLPPDGSSSPRVTRSQSKLKQKKSAGSPKSSPTESPLPVRKSLRKKTANSKYEAEDIVKTTPKSAKKETPGKGKGSEKNSDKDLGKAAKSVDSSEFVDDVDLKKSGKPYSLRDREEKGRGRGSKTSLKDGNQKFGEASSVVVGNSGLSESIMELPEKKKDIADDWPEEKGSGVSLKIMEQDRKSVSSSCSVDVEPEMNLSLPPKFRRTKRKTMSTSQSLSSVEDERSSEGVKDIKIDLYRPVDLDPSSYAGCCKNQVMTETSLQSVNSSTESESKGNSEENKRHFESCEVTSQVAPSSVLENKPVQEPAELDPGTADVMLDESKKSDEEMTADVEKRIGVEKTVEIKLGPEKKSDTDKPSELKGDRQNRSTGGKKSLLYRSSLNAMLDDSVATATTVIETNVSPCLDPVTQVTVTVVEENNGAKLANETHTKQFIDEPGDSVNKSEEKSAADLPPQNSGNDDITSKESIVSKQESAVNRDSIESVTEPGVKPILDTIAKQPSPPGIHVPPTDTVKFVSKETTKVFELEDAPPRHMIPVTTDLQGATAHCSESAVTSFGKPVGNHDSSVPDIPAHSFASRLNADRSENFFEEQTCAQAVVYGQSKGVAQSSLVQSVEKDGCSGVAPSVGECEKDADDTPDNDIQESQEKEPVSSTVQSASKRKAVEDNSFVLNKKTRRDDEEDLDVINRKMPVGDKPDEPSDDKDSRSNEIDESSVVACTTAKISSVINPLQFYNRTATMLSGAAGFSSVRQEPGMSSSLNLSHAESTLPAVISRVPASFHSMSVNTTQSTLHAGKSLSAVSSDLQPSTNDSEPPVLEKTDFTYTEQFSDISDTDEDENRGPPLLEATNSCASSGAKPCSSFALDKHILFAKIASSALQDGVTSIGLQSNKQNALDLMSHASLPVSGKQFGEHKQVVSSKNNSCPTAVLKNVLDDSSSFRGVEIGSHPGGSCSVSHVPPSVSMGQSLNTPIGNKTLDAAALPGNLPVAVTQQNNNSSKRPSQKSQRALRENETSKPGTAVGTAFSSSKDDYHDEGDDLGCAALGPGNLESCGIATTSAVKDTPYKTESKRSAGKSTSRPVHGAKNESSLDSLLQHCKSVTVVVQKIDGGHKSQHQSDSETVGFESVAVDDYAADDGRLERQTLHETTAKKPDSVHRKSDLSSKTVDVCSRVEAEVKTTEAPSNEAERSEAIQSKTESSDKMPNKAAVANKNSDPNETNFKRKESVQKDIKFGSSNKKAEKRDGVFNKPGKAELLHKKLELMELPAKKSSSPKTEKTFRKRVETMDSGEQRELVSEMTASADAVQPSESVHDIEENSCKGTENKPNAITDTTLSCSSNKVARRNSNSRKRKPKVTSEAEVAEFCDQKLKSSDVKIPKADKKDLGSVYDFEKDSLSTDFDTPAAKKEFLKKVSQVEVRRPLRLKLLIPEQQPVEGEKMPTAASKLVSTNNAVSKPGKDRLRKTDSIANKRVQDSEEKVMDATLDSNSNSSAVGHVKCRLVKVGRHQWMSVGEDNIKESSFGTVVDQTTCASEVSHSDESLLDSKSLKQTGKKSGKTARDKTSTGSSKQNRTRAKGGQTSRQKQVKRGTKTVACSDISLSDNSLLSQDQSAGVLSPHSSVDRANRCSESESMNAVAVEHSPSSATNLSARIPDFLDALLGDDFSGLGYDEVHVAKDVGALTEIRCATERANFGKIAECELEDYLETLSPALTFFMPSEIEVKMAKMTISDHSPNANRTCLASAKILDSKVMTQQSDNQELQLLTRTRNAAPDDIVPQSDKENSLELDRLLTETLNNRGDKDDELANQLGEEVMEEFVSWLSPNWNETHLDDLEDPWSSMNLLSPLVDLQNSWECLNT